MFHSEENCASEKGQWVGHGRHVRWQNGHRTKAYFFSLCGTSTSAASASKSSDRWILSIRTRVVALTSAKKNTANRQPRGSVASRAHDRFATRPAKGLLVKILEIPQPTNAWNRSTPTWRYIYIYIEHGRFTFNHKGRGHTRHDGAYTNHVKLGGVFGPRKVSLTRWCVV